VPAIWRVTLAVLVLCLVASIVIGTYRLVTTPTEILGDGFQGWRGERFPR
jgi:Na+-transporting NADH:ubiquinone oxidoreductase subunit NqrC